MVSENTQALHDYVMASLRKNNINLKDLNDLLGIAISAFKEDVEWTLKVTDYIKQCCDIGIKAGYEVQALDKLEWEVLRVEAPYKFESFLLYMDKKRRPQKRFYEPRRRTLKVVVDNLQELEENKFKFLGISLPPRTGKSTLCIFFLAWVIGRHPESHNAMSGHSGILADRFYMDVFKLTQNEEYTYSEIFPNVHLERKSSEKNELYFSATEAFATLTARGIDGTWTGAVDISSDGYLYVDDMVRDRGESLSPKRLEGRYQDYLNVLVDRKNDGSKELMVGTRWNILDPLGRVETENKNNPEYRFIKIPALNENGESNFQYDYGVGFSTEYYREMRSRLDKNEWEAKYQQRPFVREGLLFPADRMQYYNGTLPDGEFFNASACDVAWGGGDNLSMPFGKAFKGADGLTYITSWVFTDKDKYTTKPMVIAKVLQEKPNMVRFEANNGGDEYAEDVQTGIENEGFKTNITWKRADNKTTKMAKIIQYAQDIIRNFVFLAPDKRDEQYQNAMDELNMFTQMGDNLHDDAADSLTQLYILLQDFGVAKTEIYDSPY